MAATLLELLLAAKTRLGGAPHAPPRREANLLLAHALGWTEARLLAHADEMATPQQSAAFGALVERRLGGEPVAYLLGEKEFFGRAFAVDSRALIPRPETEHVVEAALALDLPVRARVLDLGTGSGCIAVTMALELRGTTVVATDADPAALALARCNVRRFAVDERVFLVGASWGTGVDVPTIDVVTANPPYVAPGEAPKLSPEITEFEPHRALFSAPDGLTSYRHIFAALEALRPGTPVVCEVGHRQAVRVADLARDHGFRHLRTIADYAAIARVVVVIRN